MCAAVTAVGVAAQDDEPVLIDAGLVTVNVSVSDARGRHVKGLTKEQFEVFDDRVKRQIAHFSAKDDPPAGTGKLRLSYRKGYRSFKK